MFNRLVETHCLQCRSYLGGFPKMKLSGLQLWRGERTVNAMMLQTIKKAAERRPFRPFSLRLADGSQVQIPRENYAAVHPAGKTMIVFEDDGGYRILDIARITELQTA